MTDYLELSEEESAFLAYLDSLTQAQRSKFDRLFSEEPTVVRTDLVCADCQAPLELRLGKYGRFYGCTRYETDGCKGGVSANDDGTPKGWPGDAKTRAARKQLVELLGQTSLYDLEPGENGDVRYGDRWKYRTFLKVLGKKAGAPMNIAEMNVEQCLRAVEALTIIGKNQRSCWDMIRLDCLLERD